MDRKSGFYDYRNLVSDREEGERKLNNLFLPKTFAILDGFSKFPKSMHSFRILMENSSTTLV